MMRSKNNKSKNPNDAAVLMIKFHNFMYKIDKKTNYGILGSMIWIFEISVQNNKKSKNLYMVGGSLDTTLTKMRRPNIVLRLSEIT